jgi:uncharacterized protein YegP (UPF0339 family)
MTHFDIVRTDSGHHTRLVADNGRILTASESFTRRVGAERNIVSTVGHLAGGTWALRWNVPGVEAVLVDHVGTVHDITVRYVDEKSTR